MLETLLVLLTAHLIADFVLQTTKMIERKQELQGLLVHVAVVLLVTAALTGTTNPWVYLLIGVSHAVMDWVKVHWLKNGVYAFVIDQCVHVAFIVLIVLLFPYVAREGWYGMIPTRVQLLLYQGLSIVSGLILVVNVGGVLVEKLLAPFTTGLKSGRAESAATTAAAEDDDHKGMQTAGRYIGRLERGLIFLFLLLGQPEGVGLMLAAKSVLRFADRQARSHTEYVIIGTMLSFGWAIVAATITKLAVAHWS
ncbi:hypothetical protein C1922_11010 [Stenotrophomonas sp. ZAC14D2_NAIMI4_7]|uniref:DUF3307 domain-containing protein n=1 Tax=Stenotrophomonas sp. ZAC14D2_NAIMI4_7 TaxID=2072405 RepID=UPI000D5422BB|nr:DUF3307 domain-containing protein [Stenotrophomonas sp. ZAC14D2_NAIMI4_7]AWH17791.1 hypothetical protein C1922_11010 [Stenotrophomonas sp. ZAC14D2_NAIMI4_7]